MSKAGIVYIMTNKNKTTLYIGVTNDLCRRIFEHKSHLNKNSFTDKYNLEYCIYYEEFPFFDLAIKREKELKKWNRQKKEDLINKKNPEWKVVATESGFVRSNKTFAQEVLEMVEEFEKEELRGSSRTLGMTNVVGEEEDTLIEDGMTRGSSLTLGMTDVVGEEGDSSLMLGMTDDCWVEKSDSSLMLGMTDDSCVEKSDSSLMLGMTDDCWVEKSDIMDDKVIHYIAPSYCDERGHSERSEETINNKENKNE